MIIDAHAHLVAPEVLYAYRAQLLGSGGYHTDSHKVTDDQLAESAAANLAIMDGVGTDVQFISPRPFQQMQSSKPSEIVHRWIRANNDLIARSVEMHPTRLAGVAGLPICAGEPVENAIYELERAVNDLGMIGVSVNQDPYEGTGPSPLMSDRYWYPLYEKLCELDIPAMVHSSGCYSGREFYTDHFISEASLGIMSILRGTVMQDFPELKLMFTHGGGSVPYQIGRWQAARLAPGLGGAEEGEPFEVSLRRLWFDTVLHDQRALDLLISVVGVDRTVFATERPGSGTVTNPATGRPFDDIKPDIEAIETLGDDDRRRIFEGNARALFSRFDPAVA